ncbi:hypothetical protein [Paenibacillus sp.]|uniref:hypothetical protein n=1 Tax=Paenibacillus sp. TaxID=58172 RepID=UPI002D456F99|nr:hypothetical protein [Paenibacillus sp.]HZG83512.1 hypothetical protein [Paenibacillus sp.]
MVLVTHPPLPFTPPSEPYSPYAPYAPIPTRPLQPVSAPTEKRASAEPAPQREQPSSER